MAQRTDTIALFIVRGTQSGKGRVGNPWQLAQVAVVELIQSQPTLLYHEKFAPEILRAYLHTLASVAILVRLEEYDDTIDTRYGSDDVYVINYRSKVARSLLENSFYEGSYSGGEIDIDIDGTQDRMAVARMVGRHDASDVDVSIVNLLSFEVESTAKLERASGIGEVSLSGPEPTLSITNPERQTRVFSISEGKISLRNASPLPSPTRTTWDVCISYAREDRVIALDLATRLRQERLRVFVDDFANADMWGKDLSEYLQQVFEKDSDFCIIMISESYARKRFTRFEMRAAQSRAIQSDREYILPVRLDQTPVPGLLPTVKYLDLHVDGMETVVNATLQKIRSLKCKSP